MGINSLNFLIYTFGQFCLYASSQMTEYGQNYGFASQRPFDGPSFTLYFLCFFCHIKRYFCENWRLKGQGQGHCMIKYRQKCSFGAINSVEWTFARPKSYWGSVQYFEKFGAKRWHVKVMTDQIWAKFKPWCHFNVNVRCFNVLMYVCIKTNWNSNQYIWKFKAQTWKINYWGKKRTILIYRYIWSISTI